MFQFLLQCQPFSRKAIFLILAIGFIGYGWFYIAFVNGWNQIIRSEILSVNLKQSSPYARRMRGMSEPNQLWPYFVSINNICFCQNFIYIFTPISLNFSIKATIFWNTLCFFVRYFGFNGLIFGKILLKSVPLSLANLCFKDISI